MPFKWRLKKTRKYDISTKNLFIVGVYLLDDAYLECTLNAESTGQECLNSIAQRIELSESSYFGLRYVTKKLHFRWVDLEKPLKKQLDKYAQPTNPAHSHCLYFGVMYYVIGAHKIPDEVARYHYYLQLKNDVIDGRLPCSVEQAIRLAAYSLQAEFGDYEPDKYAGEEYVLFPKSMKEELGVQLLTEAMAGHASLQGVPPLRAELQYVKEAQMMDGYGTDYYNAKDESRKDLYLGASHAGLFARYQDEGSTVYYKWGEIAKVTQNKKTLEIDTAKSSVLFQMEDSDTAKYVSRLAQLQRQFYKSSKGNLSSSLSNLPGETDGQLTTIDAQQVYIPPTDSSHSSQELVPQQPIGMHQQEQRYNTEFLQSSQQSLESSTESQIPKYPHPSHPPQYAPHPGEAEVNSQVYQHHALRPESLTPTPDEEPLYANRAALLPAYRPSPDYEAVMQQRMLQQANHLGPDESLMLQQANGTGQMYGISYSHPEINHPVTTNDHHDNYANVDALRSYGHSIYANIFQDDHNFFSGRTPDRGNNLAVHPTYSSPELNTEMHQADIFAQEFSSQEAYYQFRPPPPYPRTSSSTPDLAAVDQGNFHHQHLTGPVEHNLLAHQSALDRSVDDLSGFQNYPSQQMALPAPVKDEPNLVYNPPPRAVTEEQGLHIGDGVDGGKDTPPGPTQHGTESLPSEQSVKGISDDQDDTSSEHSYSTFHAKDSEESSEEESPKEKPVQTKEEPSIQIRMFTPKEAPPPSKLKQEATLRESFRRMKIARVGSLGKDHGGKRSSLRGVKEAPTEAQPGLKVVKEQADTHSEAAVTKEAKIQLTTQSDVPVTGQAEVTTQSTVTDQSDVAVSQSEVTMTLPPGTVETPEIKELLERLGAPPPYPGTAVTGGSSTQNIPSALSQQTANMAPKPVKRSSSDRATPMNTGPLLPPPAVKPRAGTLFNLDTVVPLSKPGMVLKRKPSSGDSPLASTKSSLSDADSFKEAIEEPGMLENDSDVEQGSIEAPLHVGPLKMASLNGLTLSRSMMLCPMNDESRAPKDERRRMLESKISEGQVYAEFEHIPKRGSLVCNAAKAPHNALRNRFKDVLPYDATRVQITPRKDNPDGYINASRIKLSAQDTTWLFIATQAPMANTAGDFWQMIWENEVNVLAMLTPFQELGKSKCFEYWPQEPGPQHKHVYNEFEVELQFSGDSLCYLTSRIILRHRGQEHLVWHLQYTAWPDHGCPEDTFGFLEFLDEVESVSRLAENEKDKGEKSPVVVHCSAGVGRTGVVILTMVMKWCLEHNHNVDLPKALLGIRNQRMHMVQTMGQYRFIHDTLIQYLKNTRLI